MPTIERRLPVAEGYMLRVSKKTQENQDGHKKTIGLAIIKSCFRCFRCFIKKLAKLIVSRSIVYRE